MSDGQIVVSGLTKQYKSVRAVDNLSFTVEPGRVTGFLGPNGAGKTTTLRMLLNLVTPTAGHATISGMRYAELASPLRHVGAVLEASSAHKGRTGRNHLRVICAAAGYPARRADEVLEASSAHKGRTGRNHLRVICAAAGYPARRADEVLELVGLTPAARRKFKGYSLGMRQRLGIAQAMLGDPKVLVLDEPANGLDPEGIRWMRDLLKHLASEGRTVLVSSHLLSEMQVLADDVLIIANGRLIVHDTMATVVEQMTDATVRVRTPDPDNLTAALDGATVAPGANGTLLITGVDAPAVGAAALRAGVELHELVSERPDLERVFLELTSGKAAIR